MHALPGGATADPDSLLLRAALLTHSGRLDDAERVCADLLGLDELNAGAHYLLALCREGRGDRAAAIDHDQVAVYLDPAFAMPRLHMGLLARRSGQADVARRELGLALPLLQREDTSRLLLFGGGFNRDTLTALCRAELGAAGVEREHRERRGSPQQPGGRAHARRVRSRLRVAPALPGRGGARLLGIRVGGDPFALALDGVLAVHVDRKIVPVPSGAPTLIGIASFRGALAPVHDLRLLLGYPARMATRWLVLVAGATPIGLAFDAFDGQLDAPSAPELPSALAGKPPSAARRLDSPALTRGLVQAGDVIRPLIDVAAVVSAVGGRPAVAPDTKER